MRRRDPLSGDRGSSCSTAEAYAPRMAGRCAGSGRDRRGPDDRCLNVEFMEERVVGDARGVGNSDPLNGQKLLTPTGKSMVGDK